MSSAGYVDRASDGSFAARALTASVIFVCVLAFAGLLWLTAHYILVFFAGILLAILFDAIARGIGVVLPVPRAVRLVLAILIVALAVSALGLVIPGIIEQAPQFANYMEEWVEWFRNTVITWEPVKQTLENGQSNELMRFLPDPAGILGGAAQILGGTMSFFAGAILIVVFGIYLATEPARYYQKSLRFFPEDRRALMAETGEDLGHVLRRWLMAQILMMLLVGLSSYAVLSFLGVPLALTLSFIAGITAFIPYIGPILGGGAMILVAATQDLSLGAAVFGFYAAVQLVESYILTPLIQSRAIFVPPAVVILAQIVFGALFGVLGIALATPLSAVIAVLVSRFYWHEPIEAGH